MTTVLSETMKFSIQGDASLAPQMAEKPATQSRALPPGLSEWTSGEYLHYEWH